jgi:flagellar biosynthesis/type III secretory pathway M-ring protein FliF/YscJ
MNVVSLVAFLVPVLLIAVIVIVLYFVIRGAVLSALRAHDADQAKADADNDTAE